MSVMVPIVWTWGGKTIEGLVRSITFTLLGRLTKEKKKAASAVSKRHDIILKRQLKDGINLYLKSMAIIKKLKVVIINGAGNGETTISSFSG
jgi:hypothetical protein